VTNSQLLRYTIGALASIACSTCQFTSLLYSCTIPVRLSTTWSFDTVIQPTLHRREVQWFNSRSLQYL